jgi:hypothetical protein
MLRCGCRGTADSLRSPHCRMDCRVKPGNDEVRKAKKNKGSGTPADAVFHGPCQAGTAARHGSVGLRRPVRFGRARLPAFHYGTCGRDRTFPLSSSHALPGTGLDRAKCYLIPAVLQYSGFPRRPVLVPAGRICPEPPGSVADEAAPAGTVPTPHRRGHRPCVLMGGQGTCIIIRDKCHITSP